MSLALSFLQSLLDLASVCLCRGSRESLGKTRKVPRKVRKEIKTRGKKRISICTKEKIS